MPQARQRIILGISITAGVLYLFANRGFRDFVLRTKEKSRLERNIARLRSEHEGLAHEWQLIQQDPSYTEYLIRKNLGYVKKGEIEYQLIKPKDKA